MAIYYLQVRSSKLSNRELGKIYEVYKAQGRLKGANEGLTNMSEKAWAIRSKFRDVTVRVPERNLQAFLERAKLQQPDVIKFAGNIKRDMAAIERALLDETVNHENLIEEDVIPGPSTNSAPDLQPAIKMQTEQTGDLFTFIKSEVAKERPEDFFQAAATNSLMDMSMAVPLEEGDFKKEDPTGYIDPREHVDPMNESISMALERSIPESNLDMSNVVPDEPKTGTSDTKQDQQKVTQVSVEDDMDIDSIEVHAEEDLENSEPQVKATGGEDASTTKEAPIPPPRGTINLGTGLSDILGHFMSQSVDDFDDEVFLPAESVNPQMELDINAGTVDMKLDTASTIPVWKKGSTEKEEIQYIRNYIRDIRRIQALKIVKSEPVLINASLVKSGRTGIYEELPKEAESTIDGFVAYLQTAYGLTTVDMLEELQDIRQGSKENPYSYLSRIVNMFYEARGESKKTLEEAQNIEKDRAEILQIYLKGLYDKRVRTALRSQLHTLDIGGTLPMLTKNIQKAVNDNKDLEVNVVHGNNKRMFGRRKFTKYTSSSWRPNKRNVRDPKQDGNKDIECFNCRKKGHMARDCRAPKSEKGGRAKDQNDKKRNLCFSCGKPGHYARDCRSKTGDQRSGR